MNANGPDLAFSLSCMHLSNAYIKPPDQNYLQTNCNSCILHSSVSHPFPDPIPLCFPFHLILPSLIIPLVNCHLSPFSQPVLTSSFLHREPTLSQCTSHLSILLQCDCVPFHPPLSVIPFSPTHLSSCTVLDLRPNLNSSESPTENHSTKPVACHRVIFITCYMKGVMDFPVV